MSVCKEQIQPRFGLAIPDAIQGEDIGDQISTAFVFVAVTGHARRRDDESCTTGCGCIGLTREREHARLDSVLQRPVRLPAVVVSWVALGSDPLKSVLGVPHHRRRDHIGLIDSRRETQFVRITKKTSTF